LAFRECKAFIISKGHKNPQDILLLGNPNPGVELIDINIRPKSASRAVGSGFRVEAYGPYRHEAKFHPSTKLRTLAAVVIWLKSLGRAHARVTDGAADCHIFEL